MTLVIVGAPNPMRMDEAVSAFEAAGFTLIDARFLDNPYWVPELRDLSGRDRAVTEYVMQQPAAGHLLEDVQRIVRDLLPLYQEKGRMHIVVAFGCTGGRHRSVVLAGELAERLREIEGVDVDFVTRDI